MSTGKGKLRAPGPAVAHPPGQPRWTTLTHQVCTGRKGPGTHMPHRVAMPSSYTAAHGLVPAPGTPHTPRLHHAEETKMCFHMRALAEHSWPPYPQSAKPGWDPRVCQQSLFRNSAYPDNRYHAAIKKKRNMLLIRARAWMRFKSSIQRGRR